MSRALDPRIPQLIVVARRYRHCDGVAIFSVDAGWRMVVKTGSPAAYVRGSRDQSTVESEQVAEGSIEQMAAMGGILADLFIRDQIA
jgi:hypothetical protein